MYNSTMHHLYIVCVLTTQSPLSSVTKYLTFFNLFICPPPPSPSVSTTLLSVSVRLFVCSSVACCFIDTREWNHMVLVMRLFLLWAHLINNLTHLSTMGYLWCKIKIRYFTSFILNYISVLLWFPNSITNLFWILLDKSWVLFYD